MLTPLSSNDQNTAGLSDGGCSVPHTGWHIEVVAPDLVKDVLTVCGLQIDDLSATVSNRFWAMRVDGLWVGCVGLESVGQVGWLRSLAVLPSWRGRGLAAALCRHVETWAERCGLTSLYLMSTHAQPWFEARGYVAVPRANAPVGLTAFRQFSSTCPAEAALMVSTNVKAVSAPRCLPAHAGAWRLAVGRALSLSPVVPRTLHVLRGRVWLTLGEGAAVPDRVLVAGDQFTVPPGAQLVMEPWPQNADDADHVLFDWVEVQAVDQAVTRSADSSRFQREVAIPLRDAWQAVRVVGEGARLALVASVRAGSALARALWGLLSYSDWLVVARGEPMTCSDARRI